MTKPEQALPEIDDQKYGTSVPCEYCNALVGQKCLTGTGKPRMFGTPHAIRLRQAATPKPTGPTDPLFYECPKCKASPGVMCRGGSSKRAFPEHHRERLRLLKGRTKVVIAAGVTYIQVALL